MVPVAGLEPARISPPHFECGTSTNSITPAGDVHYTAYAHKYQVQSLSISTHCNLGNMNEPSWQTAPAQPSIP